MFTQLELQSATDVLHETTAWIHPRGTAVRCQTLPADTPCVFDGPTITLNPIYPTLDHVLYLTHSFGSIVEWSLDHSGTQRMFDELRDAKTARRKDPQRFERAIRQFRQFEERAAEFGVEILAQIGAESWIAPFSEFFRADLDAITLFHREGVLPVWRLFFDGWTRRRQDDSSSLLFERRQIPAFKVQQFERQEVKRGL